MASYRERSPFRSPNCVTGWPSCPRGRRSSSPTARLDCAAMWRSASWPQSGFQVANLTGGYTSWEASVNHGIEEQPTQPEREADDQQTCTKEPCATKAELLTPPPAASVKTVEIDACGLQCPGPLLKLKEALAQTGPGDLIKVTASDPGFYPDVAAFAVAQGLELVDRQRGKLVTATLRRPAHAPIPHSGIHRRPRQERRPRDADPVQQ